MSYPNIFIEINVSLMAHYLKYNRSRYIGAQCYAQNAKKAELELSLCVYAYVVHTHMCTGTGVHRHTHIYFTYMCLFQFSVI